MAGQLANLSRKTDTINKLKSGPHRADRRDYRA